MPFDIHTYGDQVVSRFSQLNQWCPFAELVAGQPAFEVCRSMLASLQLANDYTVEITQQPGLEAAVDTMSLRLLTHQRAHKRFQTYTAPPWPSPEWGALRLGVGSGAPGAGHPSARSTLFPGWLSPIKRCYHPPNP